MIPSAVVGYRSYLYRSWIVDRTAMRQIKPSFILDGPARWGERRPCFMVKTFHCRLTCSSFAMYLRRWRWWREREAEICLYQTAHASGRKTWMHLPVTESFRFWAAARILIGIRYDGTISSVQNFRWRDFAVVYSTWIGKKRKIQSEDSARLNVGDGTINYYLHTVWVSSTPTCRSPPLLLLWG